MGVPANEHFTSTSLPDTIGGSRGAGLVKSLCYDDVIDAFATQKARKKPL